MATTPKKLSMALLPTPIVQLQRFSQMLGKNIWVKRDDLTGMELSGNKIRKLEYLFQYALDYSYTTIITCGGSQSNHCRAAAAIAARLGMKAILYLTKPENSSVNGNLLLDALFGAEIRYIEADEFPNILHIMSKAAQDFGAQGEKAYVIPLGGSNALGSFGYIDAYTEIAEFEEKNSVYFDVISLAIGSGGTLAGLIAGDSKAAAKPRPRQIVGMSVSADADYFTKQVFDICADLDKTYNTDYNIKREEILVNDQYIGVGYGIAGSEVVDCIRELAQKEGLIIDPVYTGKAFYGLVSEIKKGNFADAENILFIHTGGIFGVFGQPEIFST